MALGTHRIRLFVSSIIVILGTLAIIGGLLATDHQYFTRDDNANYFFPSYVYDWRAVVEQGAVPLINFHQYLGHPYLATGQSAVLYPGVYLSVALSYFLTDTPDATINIAVTLHLLIAALGMFCLLRQRKVSLTVATLMSVAYISLPIITTLSRSWISVAYTAAYLPWVFWSLHRLCARPRVTTGVMLAAVHALFLLQGNVQFVLMGGFFEIIFLILFFRQVPRPEWKKPIVTFAWSCVLATLLCLPMLLPMFHLFQVSLREVFPNTWLDSLNIVFPLFVNMVYAQVFLGPHLWHIGIPLLAFLIVLSQKSTRSWVTGELFKSYALLALITFLFSDLVAPLTHFIPVLGYFRWPWKYYVFFGFFLIPVLADIMHATIAHLPRRKWVLVLLVGAGIVLNATMNLPGNDDDLLTSSSVERPPQAIVDAIMPTAGRVFTFWLDEAPDEHLGRFYTFNFPTLDKVYAFAGYEPLVTQSAYDLTLLSTYHSIFGGDVTPEARERFNTWSVRYFVTEDTSAARERMATLGNVRLLSAADHVVVYENTEAHPFAYVEGHPEAALPTYFGVNDVTITTKALTQETVVLTVAPQQGYRIFFDNVAQGKIKQESNAPLTIVVPQGVQEVRVLYTDSSFVTGLLVSLASLVIMILVLLGSLLRNHFTSYRKRT